MKIDQNVNSYFIRLQNRKSSPLSSLHIPWMTLFSWVPIFVDWRKNQTFTGFKIRGQSIFLHNSYRKSLFRCLFHVDPSTKTVTLTSDWYIFDFSFVTTERNLTNLTETKSLTPSIATKFCGFFQADNPLASVSIPLRSRPNVILTLSEEQHSQKRVHDFQFINP